MGMFTQLLLYPTGFGQPILKLAGLVFQVRVLETPIFVLFF
jgi:hypothetical protein